MMKIKLKKRLKSAAKHKESKFKVTTMLQPFFLEITFVKFFIIKNINLIPKKRLNNFETFVRKWVVSEESYSNTIFLFNFPVAVSNCTIYIPVANFGKAMSCIAEEMNEVCISCFPKILNNFSVAFP